MNTPTASVALTNEQKACGSNFLGALGAKSPEQRTYVAVDILLHFAQQNYPAGAGAFLADLRAIACVCDLPVKEFTGFRWSDLNPKGGYQA